MAKKPTKSGAQAASVPPQTPAATAFAAGPSGGPAAPTAAPPATRGRGRPPGSRNKFKHARPAPSTPTGPVTRSEPALPDDRIDAPGPLPEPSNKWSIAEFPAIAFWRDLRLKILLVAWVGLTAATWIWPPPLTLMQTLIIAGIWLPVMFMSLIWLTAISVEEVWVERKLPGFGDFKQRQLWWKSDIKKWSNVRRVLVNSKRILWIDAQHYDEKRPSETLFVFNPRRKDRQLRPDGMAKELSTPWPTASPSDLSIHALRGLAGRAFVNVKNPLTELIQQGLLIIVICGALLAIYLGGTNITESRKEATIAQTTAEIEARVRQQLLNELSRPSPIQPTVNPR